MPCPLSYRWLNRTAQASFAALVCLVLSACGGSGSPGAPTPSPAPAPVPMPVPVPVPIPMPVAPALAVLPATQTVQPGQSATFSASASGFAPLTYQWTRNGVAIEGATSATYTLAAATLDDNGDVLRVTVTGAADTQSSAAASLMVGGSGLRPYVGAWDLPYTDYPELGYPDGVVIDPAGYAYVASGPNIFKVSRSGQVRTVLTHSGCYFYGGAVDPAGNYQALCNGALHKVTPSAVGLEPLAMLPDGSGYENALNIAIGKDGTMYETRPEEGRVFRVAANGERELLAGSIRGTAIDATGAAARFVNMAGITVDAQGNLLVTDGHAIRKISMAGVVTTVAGSAGELGMANGAAAQARFNWPRGIVVDSKGNIFVADFGNYMIRKISPDGQVSTLAGSSPLRDEDGVGPLAGFSFAKSLAIDAQDNLLLTDFDSLRLITPDGRVTTLAGRRPAQRFQGWIDGMGKEARFKFPNAVAINAGGELYVTDSHNHAIRKISTTGQVSTVAGGPHLLGNRDGPLASAGFNYPRDLAVMPDGTVYAFSGGLRKISAGVVSTVKFAPDPLDPRAADGSLRPFHVGLVAADGLGNLFVAGRVTSADYCDPASCSARTSVRKIAPDGTATTLLSSQTMPAGFESPRYMTTDKAGNLYLFGMNSAFLKISPAGSVTTLLGPDPAAVKFVSAMAVDAGGNVYFLTYSPITNEVLPATIWRDGRMGKITPEGVLSTVDVVLGEGPADARKHVLRGIQAMTFDASGALYLASMSGVTKLVLP